MIYTFPKSYKQIHPAGSSQLGQHSLTFRLDQNIVGSINVHSFLPSAVTKTELQSTRLRGCPRQKVINCKIGIAMGHGIFWFWHKQSRWRCLHVKISTSLIHSQKNNKSKRKKAMHTQKQHITSILGSSTDTANLLLVYANLFWWAWNFFHLVIVRLD